MITGSQGFIGSHLVNELISKNKIIGVNDTLDRKKFNYFPIKKDITKLTTNDLLTNVKSIVHLAAITDVELCNKKPNLCFNTNVGGTQNVLEIEGSAETLKHTAPYTMWIGAISTHSAILTLANKLIKNHFANVLFCGEITKNNNFRLNSFWKVYKKKKLKHYTPKTGCFNCNNTPHNPTKLIGVLCLRYISNPS